MSAVKGARTLAALAAALALAGAALAQPPKLVSLQRAVNGVYEPKAAKIVKVCRHDTMGDLYAMVTVTVAGKRGLVALQFINGQGWFAMWADGKVRKAVPASQRKPVLDEVVRLKAKCLAP